MYGPSKPFSYFPMGFSQDDLHLQKRAFQQDEPRLSPLHKNSNMFRPNGKSIFMQRKEYSELLNRHSDGIYVRVEHLFTCELDGRELKTVEDCVTKLKRLDSKGRLWPQEMIMEVQRGYLVLSDIETKSELESFPLNWIAKTRAVLDSCAYNSLLILTVEDRNKRLDQIYMFQCEEIGADPIKTDLDKAIGARDKNLEPRREVKAETPDIKISLENIINKHTRGGFQQPYEQEYTPPPPDILPSQWREPRNMTPPVVYTPPESRRHSPNPSESRSDDFTPAEKTEIDINTEIFNHVVSDFEVFLDKISSAVNRQSPMPAEKSKKKMGLMMKKSKKAAPVVVLPTTEEYVSTLQKIKYGLNLLGQLDGALSNPSAPEFVHIFFSSLGMIVPLYPADVPATVVSPLLTVAALRLLSQVLNAEEDRLWRSLGESWNVPRSRWPEDVPPYIPNFYNGWKPPAPSYRPSSPPQYTAPITRSNSQHFPSGRPAHEEPVTNGRWATPPPTYASEPPLYMRVIYDFMARNSRELSVMKGDMVQVIQKSKQWWLVRNNRDEEGNIPQNVLEPMRGNGLVDDPPPNTRGGVTLDMNSTSAQVKAWLEHKGFSRITVGTLGVLTGKLLLGMTKDEIRTVCPEEGGKVFFQLQAVKSAIALANEQSGMYNGRY